MSPEACGSESPCALARWRPTTGHSRLHEASALVNQAPGGLPLGTVRWPITTARARRSEAQVRRATPRPEVHVPTVGLPTSPHLGRRLQRRAPFLFRTHGRPLGPSHCVGALSSEVIRRTGPRSTDQGTRARAGHARGLWSWCQSWPVHTGKQGTDHCGQRAGPCGFQPSAERQGHLSSAGWGRGDTACQCPGHVPWRAGALVISCIFLGPVREDAQLRFRVALGRPETSTP